MVMKASRLGQPDDMPVACYRTKKAPLQYITGSRIATLLCEAVKKVQPSTSTDDLKKTLPIPSVSGLVCSLTRQACPNLHSKTPPLMGDSFKMYLRDTKAIQDKHLAALQSALSNVVALIGTPPDDIVHLTATMSDLNIPNDILEDDQMGTYIDKMD
jgi:hypothetical protein